MHEKDLADSTAAGFTAILLIVLVFALLFLLMKEKKMAVSLIFIVIAVTALMVGLHFNQEIMKIDFGVP